ncbi:MAG: hypothetical protein JOY56_08905 [Solirubrobacterales bacterium]|nr:hypothetical protein [Solirubrobacterales bacterium]
MPLWLEDPARIKAASQTAALINGRMDMEASEEDLGPIDVVVIGYPPGAPLTGEAVPIVLDLVDRGIIRVFDARFVVKNEDGTFSGFDLADLDQDTAGDLTAFAGASTGLLGDDDVESDRGGTRAAGLGGDDRVREPLGSAVCHRCSPQRWRAHRKSAN